MRYIPYILQIVLGLFFVIFGLNGLLSIWPLPPLPEAAFNLIDAMKSSGYLYQLIMLCEIFSGLLLISNRWVPLGLAILLPINVNILLFDAFLNPQAIFIPVMLCLLNVVLCLNYFHAYRPLLSAKIEKNSGI